MKTRFLLCMLAAVVLSCSEDSDPGEGGKNTTDAPSWVGEYPSIASGATSIDLKVQTDRNAKVYYLLTTQPVNYSAKEFMKQAQAPSNAAIKANGIIEAAGSKENVKTIAALTQSTRYYTYFLAQNVTDTLYQNSIISRNFSTQVRQDTSEFQSSVENRKVKYLLYRPEEVFKNPTATYPIIIFLGGNGEVATAEKPVNMIRNGSLPEYIHKGNNVPMMVMSVQHTVQNWNTSLIDEAIEHARKTYPVNTSKIYMVGISGGGFGCWNYAVSHPEKLAAIVPISGGGNTSKACLLKSMDVWAFHNQVDNIVASSNSVNMINAIKKCPSEKEVKLLLFPDTGHDCWRRVFDKNHANWTKSPAVEKVDVYTWLLSKSR